MARSTLQITDSVDGVLGTRLYQVVDDAGVPVPGKRLAVVGLMHGNEPVGGPVLDQIHREAAAHLRAGSILSVRANLLAEAENRRHTQAGDDMNRMWDSDTLVAIAAMDPADRCYEQGRVAQLAPLIIACDAILDPTHPGQSGATAVVDAIFGELNPSGRLFV